MSAASRMTSPRFTPYVELGRTFKVLPDGEISDDSQRLDPASAYGKSLTWNDLLAMHRVVILSEAGSGKTEEIRHAAQRLRNEGKAAFFLRLENVCTGIEEAFDVGSHDDYQDWLRTGDEAWLFLDSVDEARLQSPKDFEKAIRAIRRLLGDALSRARIVITSRASEWRPVSDLRLCETHIALHRPQDQAAKSSRSPNDSSFQFVTLEDLSREQAKVFAKACALEDLDSFFKALDQVGEGAYHERPADLLDLFGLWRNKRRFGTRLELIRERIKGRLTEHDQDRDQVRSLDRDKAYQAAKSLAAAATLSRYQEVLVPGSARHRSGIDVEDVLSEWTALERITLLSRPLFDEETYGTVRFHHRSAREYLTAEWFADLLRKGSSRRNVEALLFREQYGHPIVAPVLRPILPWLVHLDDRICRIVQDNVPEILLEGGDPDSLPIETRRVALGRICERLARGDWDAPLGIVGRLASFAHEDLTGSIRAALKLHAGSGPALEFLLQLIWKGRLAGAWPEVAELIRTDSGDREVGGWGWIAANAIGTKGQLQELREWYLNTAAVVKREILIKLIEGLPSDEDSSRWLQMALERCVAMETRTFDRLEHELTDYVERLREEHLPALLLAFDRLLSVETQSTELGELPGRHRWLLGPACQVVARLIQARHAAALDNASVSTLLRYGTTRSAGIDPKKLKHDLRSLIAEWPELNVLLFWESIGQERVAMHPSEKLTQWWQATHRAFFQARSIPFASMLDAISTKEAADDRAVALSLAIQLFRNAESPSEWLEQLREATSSSHELTIQLEQFLAPPKLDAELAWEEDEKLWQKECDEKRVKAKREWDTYFSALRANLAALRNSMADDPGSLSNEVINLYDACPKGNSSNTSYSFADWRALETEFGYDVARFYRDAAITLWRNHVPKIRSEGAAPNETTYAVLVGLSGLAIEFHEDPDWLDSLTPEDAECACRYASFELNGFPSWYADLFKRFPSVVGKFLLEEIRYELEQENSGTKLHHVIDRLGWAAEWSRDWLAPRILELLAIFEPTSQDSLDTLLKILRESALSNEAIADLCNRKCRDGSDVTGNAASWLAAWIGVSPEEGLASLDRHLTRLEGNGSQTEFVMQCIVRIGGSRHRSSVVARNSFHEVRHLMALHRLAYRHVRIEEDIDRSHGGVYSPSLRDHAQDARGIFLDHLVRAPGKEAYLALLEVAEEAHHPRMRSWILKRAREKAEQEGDLEAWSPDQVRDFQQNHERTPRSHKELAELAKLRLLDLKDELENGDQSIASLLLQQEETDVRQFLCSILRERANCRYQVVQEEELADAKRPDLRLNGMGFDGPVPVELKLANKWTGNELGERLQNQLGGDYLRDRRSSRGIFLLVNQKAGRKWDFGSKRLSFDELVPALQNHWESIKGGYPNIDAIDVIGIDLTARKR